MTDHDGRNTSRMTANRGGKPHRWSVAPRTLSISQLTLIVLLINVLLLSILAGFTLVRVGTVNAASEDQRIEAARRELDRAVDTVVAEVKYVAHRVSRWDETRAQFENTSLYRFWRTQQLIHPDRLPTYVEALELYDENGRALAPAEDALLPAWIAGPGEFITKDRNGNFYQAVVPIAPESDTGAEPVRGLLGVRVDLDAAAKGLKHYRDLDPDSLSFSLPAGETIGPDRLRDYAVFELISPATSLDLAGALRKEIVTVFAACLLISTLGGIVTQRMLTRPMATLGASLEAPDPENLLAPLPRSDSKLRLKEVERLRTALNQYRHRVEELHSHLDSKNEQVAQLLRYDPLTGTRSRRAFDDDWASMHAVLAGHSVDVSCIMFDCDHLRAINASYNHTTGDEVLRGITRALRGALRDGDDLYRLGSDEFLVILVEAKLDYALSVGRRCLEEIQNYPFADLGVREPIRLSAGVSHALGTNRLDLASLQRRAERALTAAKRPGGSKLVAYQLSLDDKRLDSNRYINAAYRLMEGEKLLELVYQPIIDSKTRQTVIYEALARIRDETGLISPVDFLPIIAFKGLEAEFDHLVIEEALSDLDLGRLPETAGISINLSAGLLMQHDIVDVLAPLRKHLAKRTVMLEITETAMVTSLNQVSQRLMALREQGFTIALDDFGSGYSSLSYLSRMPVDVVKFDIGMVRDLGQEGSQRRIVLGMAKLIKDTGYRMVAEGIESKDLDQETARAGFHYQQGFRHGKPMERGQLTDSTATTVASAV